LFSCSGVPQWRFNTSGFGYVIESLNNIGYCMQGVLQEPSPVAPCNPRDPSFVLSVDNYNQIYYVGSDGKKNCLDIYQGGPQVGFYACKNMINGTNQNWKLNMQSGQIQSLYSEGSCVVAGGSVFVVYTNGDTAELLLNGQGVFKQNVKPFESGTFMLPNSLSKINNITVLVTKDGKLWAKDVVLRPGSPVSISLEIERPTNGNPIFSDGQDVALLTASVLDSNGNIVRSANNEIAFVVSNGDGRVVGTGNGNPTYNGYPDQGNKRPVWNGLARALIGANISDKTGTITVQAISPGLKTAQVQIPTQPKVSKILRI